MRAFWRMSAVAASVLGLEAYVLAQPTFQLAIDAPGAVNGEAGELVSIDAAAVLTSAGIATADGVEGWSLSIRADDLTLTAATTAGTAGAPLADGGLRRDDGFESIQLTTGAGNAGVVAGVVLATGTDVTLPPAGSERVLRLTATATVPNPFVSGGEFFCDPLQGRIFFADGLRGSGQPVKNKVSYRGIDYRPGLGSTVVSICPRLEQPRFALSFDVPPALLGEAGDPATFEARALLTTSDNAAGEGAEGWSVSIASQGGRIVSATTAGTVAALSTSGGLRRADGFEKTELTTGAGNQGVVSAVTLSTSDGTTLPPLGTQRILRMTVEATTPQPIASGGRFSCEPLDVSLHYIDGRRGSGQPVRNRASFRGLGLVPSLAAGTTALCPRLREPRYTYNVSAPASLSGAAGSTAEYTAFCVLGSSNNTGADGAAGWSLSLRATDCTIAEASFAGTLGALLSQGGLRRPEGFEKTELTTGAGNTGVISAVVLSTQEEVTLPPEGAARVLRLRVQGVVPQPVRGPGGDEICVPRECVLTYVDGLRGSGQPVNNRASYRGLPYKPVLSSTRTILCPPLVNPLAMRVEVVAPEAADEGDFGDKTGYRIDVPAGTQDVDLTAGVFLASDLQGRTEGALGWAFSLVTAPGFGVAGGDFSGTAYQTHSLNGFQKTEIVNPARNGGRQGLVSAVVLSLSEPRALPAVGDELLLKVLGRLDTSGILAPGDSTEPVSAELTSPLVTGLRGTGAPVDTVVTVFNPVSSINESRGPVVKGASIRAVGAAAGRFARGNANNDAQVDISDPVWILDYLFRGGAAILCLDSADGNNDARVDISDPIYILGFLFLGTAPPPPPYPACGLDPEGDGDGVGCAETQSDC